MLDDLLFVACLFSGFFFLNPEKEAKRARGGSRVLPMDVCPLWTPPVSPIQHSLGIRLLCNGLAGAQCSLSFSLLVGAALPCTASRRWWNYKSLLRICIGVIRKEISAAELWLLP